MATTISEVEKEIEMLLITLNQQADILAQEREEKKRTAESIEIIKLYLENQGHIRLRQIQHQNYHRNELENQIDELLNQNF